MGITWSGGALNFQSSSSCSQSHAQNRSRSWGGRQGGVEEADHCAIQSLCSRDHFARRESWKHMTHLLLEPSTASPAADLLPPPWAIPLAKRTRMAGRASPDSLPAAGGEGYSEGDRGNGEVGRARAWGWGSSSWTLPSSSPAASFSPVLVSKARVLFRSVSNVCGELSLMLG